jgi:hypothetical protein
MVSGILLLNLRVQKIRDNITYIDYATDAWMLRSEREETILLVEGTTDESVYKYFIDNTRCKIIPVDGKEIALQTIDILEKDGFNGVFVIVDNDFWKLDNFIHPSSNVLVTDYHDLECMILNSGALEKFLDQYGSKEKIKNLNQPIREILLNSAKPIGYLRWISLQRCMNLKFEELKFNKFIDKENLKINIQELIKKVKENSKKSSLKNEEIFQDISDLAKQNHNPWQVCNGHDLIQILYIGLMKKFATKKSTIESSKGKKTKRQNVNIALEHVEKNLRLAYEFSMFCLTELYKSIKAWEANNPTYKVLKQYNF